MDTAGAKTEDKAEAIPALCKSAAPTFLPFKEIWAKPANVWKSSKALCVTVCFFPLLIIVTRCLPSLGFIGVTSAFDGAI